MGVYMNKRVFILDDEPAMVEIATKILEEGRYVINSSTNPTEGLKQIRNLLPDLVLLDVSMDEMDGLEVCKALKSDVKTRHIPIIFVSVKGEVEDVVVGLEIGADDYLRKPLKGPELLARIKTVLRRTGPVQETNRVQTGPLTVDYESYKAWLDGEPMQLTPKQFELLGLFIQNAGKVLTRSTMMEKVWGADFKGFSRTVDTTVDQIRRKLGTHRGWIQTLKGVGYRFEVTDKAD